MDGLLNFLGIGSAAAPAVSDTVDLSAALGDRPAFESAMAGGGGTQNVAIPAASTWFDKLGEFAKSPTGQATRSALGTIGGGGQTNLAAPTLNRQLGPAFTVPTATDPLAGLMQSINAKRARLASLGVGGSYA